MSKPRNRKKIYWLLAGALITALLITAPVFAEGEAPPEVPASEEEAAPAEEAPAEETAQEAAPAEEPPAEETTPAEEPAAEEAPAEQDAGEAPDEPAAEPEAPSAEEEPAVEPPVDEEPVAEPVEETAPAEEAPPADETAPVEKEPAAEEEAVDVVVVDESGEPQDMASEATAETLSAGDPWWKVGTTMYAVTYPAGTPGDNCPVGTTYGVTCWESPTPISEALNKINDLSLLPSDRKLYVEADYYNETVDLSAFTRPYLAQMNGLIGAGSDITTIDGDVYIDQNTGGFTLSGFTINGMVGVWDSAGTLTLEDLDVSSPGNDGIYVSHHNGSVNVSEVESHDNYGNGASIDTMGSSGSVTIKSSSFNNNGNTDDFEYGENGILVYTDKYITIENVVASGNLGNGMNLNGFKKLTIKHAIANDNESPFSQAGYLAGTSNGIYASGWSNKASVTLENIQANHNANGGVVVFTQGNVKAEQIEAHHNTVRLGSILYDYTYLMCVDWECTETEEVTETIDQVSEFLSDDVDFDVWRFELDALSNVDIMLDAHWDEEFDPYLVLYQEGNPTPWEDDNSLDGHGAYLSLLDLPAGTYYIQVERAPGSEGWESGVYDLSINPDGEDWWRQHGGHGFSFTDGNGSGTLKFEGGSFFQNAQNGINVWNRNSVTISSVFASWNGHDGIHVDKTAGEWDCSGGEGCEFVKYAAKGTVTITSPKSWGSYGANRAMGNGGFGVYVQSKGNISVYNIDAMNNGQDGLYLDTCLEDWETGLCRGSGKVTVGVKIPHWYNGLNENGGSGAWIESYSNVKLEKSYADGNMGSGFNVESWGTITLKNASAYNNQSYGAFLDALHAPRARNILVENGEFNDNHDTGLKVITEGTI